MSWQLRLEKQIPCVCVCVSVRAARRYCGAPPPTPTPQQLRIRKLPMDASFKLYYSIRQQSPTEQQCICTNSWAFSYFLDYLQALHTICNGHWRFYIKIMFMLVTKHVAPRIQMYYCCTGWMTTDSVNTTALFYTGQIIIQTDTSTLAWLPSLTRIFLGFWVFSINNLPCQKCRCVYVVWT